MENKINKHNPPTKKTPKHTQNETKKERKKQPPPKPSTENACKQLYLICFWLSSLQSLTKFTK